MLYIPRAQDRRPWYITELMVFSASEQNKKDILHLCGREILSHLLRVSLDLLPSVDSLKELLLLLVEEQEK